MGPSLSLSLSSSSDGRPVANRKLLQVSSRKSKKQGLKEFLNENASIHFVDLSKAFQSLIFFTFLESEKDLVTLGLCCCWCSRPCLTWRSSRPSECRGSNDWWGWAEQMKTLSPSSSSSSPSSSWSSSAAAAAAATVMAWRERRRTWMPQRRNEWMLFTTQLGNCQLFKRESWKMRLQPTTIRSSFVHFLLHNLSCSVACIIKGSAPSCWCLLSC